MSPPPPTDLLVIRHAPTSWNEQQRLQGRTDLPLSERGRAEALAWRLPDGARRRTWLTSPLQRAVMTASQLGVSARIEPCLTEMDWGQWEGLRLEELRAEALLSAAAERQGLDFRPPGGESPREVQQRLRPWLATIGVAGRPLGVITHKGVIRALQALATGWTMVDKPAVRLKDGHAHRFAIAADGTPSLIAANLPLT